MGKRKGTDIFWQTEWVPMSYRQRAARLCLVRRLYSKIDLEALSAKSPELVLKVASLRRRFFEGLRDAGWDKLHSDRKNICVRNCPPVGLKTQTSAIHAFMEERICPFCWVRLNVVKNFELFERAFFVEKVVRQDLPYPVSLLTTVRYIEDQTDYTGPEHGLTEDEAFDKQMEYMNTKVRDNRRYEVGQLPNDQFLGGLVLHRIDFGECGQPLLRRCGIFVVKADMKLPYPPDVNPAILSVRMTKLSRHELMKAFVRVAPYRGGWIREASAEKTLRFMKATRRLRMSATFGRLRASSTD